jgi:phospholipase/carboxylesterase
VRFVLPTAPNRAVNYLGRKANSWYDVTLVKTRRYTWKVIDDFVVCDPEQMAESVARIEKLLAIEEAAGVPPRRIFLLGFSQGGALATTVFLRTQRALGGMMGISTWMPFQQAYSINGVRGTQKSDVRFQHGEDDKAVNLTWVQSSVKRLRALGYNAEVATFKGQGHALVNNEVVVNIENFVQDRAPGEVQVLFRLLDDVTKRFTDASRQINNAMPQALSAGLRALRARRRTTVADGSGVAHVELN